MWSKAPYPFIPSTVLPWVIPAIAVAGWFAVSSFTAVPAYLLPHPVDVAAAGFDYIFGHPGDGPYAGRFAADAGSSAIRVMCGFSCAVVFGVPLGILSGRVSRFHQLMGTSINALRAVPGISWLPLAMVWFGVGIRTTVFLIGLAAFFPVYLNCAAGARQVNPLLLQAGAMMGVNRFRGTFSILLPGAMPHIVTGLRLGLGISWAYLVLGELTGVPNGLGAVIMDARMTGRIDIVVLGIIVVAVIGRFSDQLLKTVMKLCFKSAGRML